MSAPTRYRVVLYSPDRAVVYDGRTPDQAGVGGGITARVALVGALAAAGHDVTAYVNCRDRIQHGGVTYIPVGELDAGGAAAVDTDAFIAMSTGGDLSFEPLRRARVQARVRMLWVQGVPKPAALDAVAADVVVTASRFLRDVCVDRWGIAADRVVPCYNGLHQERFARVEAQTSLRPEPGPGARDPFALAYIGPPEKGLGAAIEVLRRLRARDARYHLDVFGGGRLWGRADDGTPPEPGLRAQGLVGQTVLVPRLFEYEFCLAPQAMEEGFGIAVQEAKRAGVIVIASRVGAFGELIVDGDDGFLVDEPHTSPAAHARMAGLILDLAAAPGRRARLRRRAIAASSTLSWTAAARTWTALIDRHIVPYAGRTELQSAPRTGRVLVAGYYGHGNLGDEAILEVMLAELRRELPSLQVTVASGDPARTRAVHRVDAVHERDVPALLDAADRADAVVLGGGGLFQDHFGVDDGSMLSRRHWGLTFFSAFPVLAAIRHRPFVLFGVGVGPLGTDEGRRHTRLIFERASVATVRDAASRDLLRDIGVATASVEITADPAFLADAAPATAAKALLSEAGVPSGRSRLVVVALRAWRRGTEAGRWQGAVAAALDRIVEARQAAILFVPCQSTGEDYLTDDRAVAERVRAGMRHRAAAIIAPAGFNPAETQRLFATSDLVVAMRLHGVILAANAGAPIVAIAYDPKVRAVMGQLGLERHVVDLASITADALTAAMNDQLEAGGRGRRDSMEAGSSDPATINAALPALRAAARTNTTRLVDLLRDGTFHPPAASAEWTAFLEDTLAARARQADAMETRADGLAARVAAQADALAVVNAEVRRLRSVVDRRSVRAYLKLRRTARAVVRRVLVAPLKGVRAAISRRLMSGPAYVFDRYKRARMAAYGPDLAGLRAPGEPDLVSVVLPVFNGAAFVGEAIDSILAQTHTNLELIIVDDGSTDDTAKIVEAYAARDAGFGPDGGRVSRPGPSVRVVHQDNRQLPAALSRGFRMARGEFLTWTSADNRMKPRCLEAMVACLRGHPSWDMTYANIDVIGEDGAAWRDSPHYEGYQRPHGSEHVALPSTTAELNVVANNSIGAAFLYRSRVPFLVGDYSPRRFVMEDYDYWMRVNALMTIRHAGVRDPLYDYRFHRRSLTSRWEEFDMLGRRDRLMVFDDFRRDVFLQPMVWMIDGAGGPAATLAADLDARARAAGHVVHAGQFALADLPALGAPVVYARVTGDPSPDTAPREGVPASALRVLVTNSRALPDRMHEGWDVCIAVGAIDGLPRLARDYQGWLAAADVATLFQAVDARSKSAHLERFEVMVEAPAPPSGPVPKASVIICTRRWSDRLDRALGAVAAQQVPHPYEVIVVDNGRKDLGGLFTEDVKRLPRSLSLRVVRCPVPGLSAARNAGLAAARGELVCFLDDDALPDPDWLAWVCRAFDEHPSCVVVGGHIRLKTPDVPPRALRPVWRKYWSEFLTDYAGYTEVGTWSQFPWGANWSARRDALRAVGGFRSRYGRTGDDYWGGEEMVAACLMQRLGGAIAIEPRASVVHDVDPARFTPSHVVRTMRAGASVYLRAQHDLYVPRPGRVAPLALLSELTALRHRVRRSVS